MPFRKLNWKLQQKLPSKCTLRIIKFFLSTVKCRVLNYFKMNILFVLEPSNMTASKTRR